MRKTPLRSRLAMVAASALTCLGVLGLVPGQAGLAAPAQAAPTTLPAAQCAANKAVGKVTFVSPFGFGPGPGLLEIFVAKQLGFFADECLNVNIVTSSYVPNQLVSAGTAQFTSEGSAADTLEAIASGSHFVSIATFADSSTYVLLTTTNITNLKQLAGKTLAYHTAMPVVLTEMLKKAGVNVSKVKEVNDTSYDPSLLDKGRFNALQAYAVNEPLTLKAEHLPFKEWYPAHFGVSGTFNTVVVNTAFLKAHPAATADFLRAELHGIDYCEAHGSACIHMEAKDAEAAGSDYQIAHSLEEWNKSMDIVRAHSLPGAGIGVQSDAEWQPELKAIRTYHIVSKVPPLSSAMDNSIVTSLYKGKTLIWPGS